MAEASRYERCQVSAAIQTHPSRIAMALALAARVGGAEIVLDPDPDNPRRSAWRTYRAALEGTPAGATHRLIVQDDADPCPHLVAVCERIVEACGCGTRLVVLFVAGMPTMTARAVYRACDQDERFALIPNTPWVPLVAALWPVNLVWRALDYIDRQPWPEEFVADDEIVGRTMTGLGEDVYATVPSLVEHPDLVRSLATRRTPMGGRSIDRVAACMLDSDIDPLTVAWK